MRLTLSLCWYLTSVNRKFIFKFSSGQTLRHQARFHQLNRMVLFRKVLFWKIFSSKLDLISSIKTFNSGNKGKTETEQLTCQRLSATYIYPSAVQVVLIHVGSFTPYRQICHQFHCLKKDRKCEFSSLSQLVLLATDKLIIKCMKYKNP